MVFVYILFIVRSQFLYRLLSTDNGFDCIVLILFSLFRLVPSGFYLLGWNKSDILESKFLNRSQLVTDSTLLDT